VAGALAAGGRQALASKGPIGARCKLTAAQLRELQTVLDAGPAACGWDEDQCWMLARIADLVRRRFEADYILAGLDLVLVRREALLFRMEVKDPIYSPS
jgi:hypothetical protein